MNNALSWLDQILSSPGWSSETWAWILLFVTIGGVVFRFVAERTKTKRADKAIIAVDILEDQVRNQRRKALRKEKEQGKP